MKQPPIYLEADINVIEETQVLKEKASSILKLPSDGEKQLDLMYFTAIYVTSGENLNHAFFEPTEMVLAENTIVNKALDIEHNEKEVIGHLYDRVFIDEAGKPLTVDELKSMEAKELNSKLIHIAIAGIIYKNRFPEIAKEVADKKWKVSMETYYKDFDLKVGDVILPRKSAESLGLVANVSSIIGKVAKVIKNGKEIAEGTVARVLRGLSFSGCGLVENPANPPSIILEVAGKKKAMDSATDPNVIVINLDNNVTSKDIDRQVSEEAELQYQDTVGICVSYKKQVLNKEGAIIDNDWCSQFEKKCTSFSRDTTDPACLRNVVAREVQTAVSRKMAVKRFSEAISVLENALKKV